MANRFFSYISILVIILLLLLLFQFGQPFWFGNEQWSIRPLSLDHPEGIFLGAFIHGSLEHILNNIFTLLLFSLLFTIQFPKQWLKFWMIQHLAASLFLWIIGGAGSAHIGASIWVYSFGVFLITTGMIHRSKQSLSVMFMVLLWFGGFLWGLLPTDPRVSWQGHLSGAIVGFLLAISLGRQWLPIQHKRISDMLDSSQFTTDEGDPYLRFED